jgi:hypothetical protein
VQLLRGVDSPRANLTRICSNTARHLLESSATSNLALAADLLEVHALMPTVSIEWLVDGLVMLPDERRAALTVLANGLMARKPEA